MQADPRRHFTQMSESPFLRIASHIDVLVYCSHGTREMSHLMSKAWNLSLKIHKRVVIV